MRSPGSIPELLGAPRADPGQRLKSVCPRTAGREVEKGLGVADCIINADLDSAEGVDDLLESVEIDPGEVVDVDAGIVADHKGKQFGATCVSLASAESGVDPRIALSAGIRQIQIARQRNHQRR